MFTGLIEEKGRVISVNRGSKSTVLTVEASLIFSDLKTGDSVAVNGICLTAIWVKSNSFAADVMNETIDKTGFNTLGPGTLVNLERAMKADGRFGGHIVTGHIDGVGTITEITSDGNATWFRIRPPKDILKYIVTKGSIAIDGISLTVAKIDSDSFMVSIIPHSLKETTLSHKEVASTVNLETDILGKYVERLLVTPRDKERRRESESNITMEFLAKNGF